MKLVKFRKVAKCEKCDSKDVYRKYCTAGEFYLSSDLHSKCGLISGQEHFDMHCRDCQFSWLENIKEVKKNV